MSVSLSQYAGSLFFKLHQVINKKYFFNSLHRIFAVDTNIVNQLETTKDYTKKI